MENPAAGVNKFSVSCFMTVQKKIRTLPVKIQIATFEMVDIILSDDATPEEKESALYTLYEALEIDP